MGKYVRVEVFDAYNLVFEFCCPEQQLSRKRVREHMLAFLEANGGDFPGSSDKEAYEAAIKNNFSFRTTRLPDEDPREPRS